MRRRPLRIAMVLLWCVWFGLILPGHERGRIALPGARGDVELSPSRHAAWQVTTGGCCTRKSSAPGNNDPVQRCAICKIVAVLDIPAPINNDAPPLGLLLETIRLQPQVVYHAIGVTIERGRAPPGAA